MSFRLTVEIDEDIADRLMREVGRQRVANPANKPNRSSIVRAALLAYFANVDTPTVRARSR